MNSNSDLETTLMPVIRQKYVRARWLIFSENRVLEDLYRDADEA